MPAVRDSGSGVLNFQVIMVRNIIVRTSKRLKPVAEERKKRINRFIITRARRYARHRTGYMKDMIQEVESGVVALARYSGFNEYGTYKMSAQPFMRPAFQDAMAEFGVFWEGFGDDITS